MLDFEITFWDWLTFFAIGLVGFIFLTIIILVAVTPTAPSSPAPPGRGPHSLAGSS